MASLINFASNFVDLVIERYKNWMADRIKNYCHHDCYCKPEKSAPPLNLELLQRYARLRENGKFLDLQINCSDGSTRSVHKFVLNSLSVKLGRSILACKYIIYINLLARKADLLDVMIFSKRFTVEFLISVGP